MLADTVTGKVPDWVVVPEMVAVPFPLSVKVRPTGSVPVRDRAGWGVPDAVIVKLVPPPVTKLATLGLVTVGVEDTVRLTTCWA